MQPILSLCGMRCDLCMAFRPNVEAHPAYRQLLSDGWQAYFGFRIPPEHLECDGCFPDGNPTIDSECPVKPCVTVRGLANCADCEDYVCDKLRGILVTFEGIQAKFDYPIPDDDRKRFIFPHENAQNLAALRREKFGDER